jgi:hypothetical protein
MVVLAPPDFFRKKCFLTTYAGSGIHFGIYNKLISQGDPAATIRRMDLDTLALTIIGTPWWASNHIATGDLQSGYMI